jgi:hypothetical protein
MLVCETVTPYVIYIYIYIYLFFVIL